MKRIFDGMRNSRLSDPQRKTIQLAFLFVFTLAGACGFNLTVSQPDRNPAIFALSLSWLILLFAGALFGEFYLKLDTKHFRFAKWELEGRVYEWVGIRAFQWILSTVRWNWVTPDSRIKSGRSDLDRLLKVLNQSEGLHKVSGVVTAVVAAANFYRGHALIGFWLFGINIILNIYPVMLQRWNRGRIFQVQRRLAMRDKTDSNFHREPTSQHLEPQAIAQPDNTATGN